MLQKLKKSHEEIAAQKELKESELVQLKEKSHVIPSKSNQTEVKAPDRSNSMVLAELAELRSEVQRLTSSLQGSIMAPTIQHNMSRMEGATVGGETNRTE